MTTAMAGMLVAVPAAPLALFQWLDSRVIGEATLIGVAAVALGYLVTRVWPKFLNPLLFGWLAAFLLTGGLAYAGSTGAGLALAVLIVVAVILAGAALVL